MSRRIRQNNPGGSCPNCGFNPSSDPMQQMGKPPYFGYYAPGYTPHHFAYQAAPTPPIHDRDILKMVSDYLKRDPRLSPRAEITVSVTNGVATLNGTVPDKWTKYFAGEDCYNVPAVVDVVNNLQISRSKGSKLQAPRS